MGKIVSYELQTYRMGAWKIDSIFDDRDLALFEAKRLVESRRHSGIRLVQEEFNEDTNETFTRILYRSSTALEANQEIIEKRAEARRGMTKSRARGPTPPKPSGPARRPPESDSTFSFGLILTAGSILLLGIAAMMALHYVATLL